MQQLVKSIEKPSLQIDPTLYRLKFFLPSAGEIGKRTFSEYVFTGREIKHYHMLKPLLMAFLLGYPVLYLLPLFNE